MKRIHAVLLIPALLILTQSLSAQQRTGIFAGIHTGKTSVEAPGGTNTTDDDDALLGIVIGATMQRMMSNGLTFAPEAMYVTKGYADEDSDGKLTMSYIEVPILFRREFASSGMIKPFLTAGPAVALQLSCKLHDDDGDTISCDDFYGDDESFAKFDAGVIIGGGLTREQWSLGIRYDLGLLNIDEGDGWTSKNKGLQFLLTYFFR